MKDKPAGPPASTPPPTTPDETIVLRGVTPQNPPEEKRFPLRPPPPPQAAVREDPVLKLPAPPPRPDAAKRESVLDEEEEYDEGPPLWAKILFWIAVAILVMLLGDFLWRKIRSQPSTSLAPLVEHLKELEKRAIATETSSTTAAAELKQLQYQLQEATGALKRAADKTEEWKAYATELEKAAQAAGFQIEDKK